MNKTILLLLISFLNFVIILFVEVKSNKQHFDLFGPPIVFSIIFLLQYIIPVFLVIFRKSYIDHYYAEFFIYYPISSKSLNEAIIFSSIGFVSFFLGYLFPSLSLSKINKQYRKSKSNLYYAYDANKVRIVVIFYSLISAFLLFFMFKRMGFNNIIMNLSNRLFLLEGSYYFEFSYILLSVNSYLILYVKKRNTLLSIFFLLLSISVAGLFGSRQAVLAPLMIYMLLYNYWVRRLHKKEIFLVLLILAILYISLHMLEELIVLGSVLSNPYGSSNLIDSILNRITAGNLIGIQQLSLIIESIRHINKLFLGKTFSELFVFFIPRRLFPFKPISPAGMLTKKFLPDLYKAGTTLPPTLIGEFYMNFSLLGIVFGMFLFGLLFRIFYRAMVIIGDFKHIFIYSILITFMYAWIRGETFSPTVLALIFYFTGIIGLKISIRRDPLPCE